MARKRQPIDPKTGVGAVTGLARNARLIWRLLRDRRVPIWTKAIVPAALIYLVAPIDLLPDAVLGLGQLDDLSILLMGFKFFTDLCPREIVQEHLTEMGSIKGSYRVVDDEQGQGEPAEGAKGYLEADYRVLEDEKKPR